MGSDSKQLSQHAADLIVSACFDVSGIALLDPSGSARMVASSRQSPPAWASLVVQQGDGLARQVLSSRQTIAVANYPTESGASEYLRHIATREKLYAMCAVPLELDGCIFGIAYGVLMRPEVITMRAQQHLADVGSLLAHAMRAYDAPLIRHRPQPAASEIVSDSSLSERERRILQLLSEGFSTREIAATEFLAVNTVRKYIQAALWKLGVNSRLQAIATARKLGLI